MRADDDLGLFLEELVTLCQKYGFSATLSIKEITNQDMYEVVGFMPSEEDDRVLLSVYRVKGTQNEEKL